MTPAGPHSRTLATFRELTPEVLKKAAARASTPIREGDLVRSAMRAGAPVAMPQAHQATRQLLAELASGKRPPPALRRLLLRMLSDKGRVPDGAQWVGATPTERAQALHDLLELTDSLPAAARRGRLHFPRLDSAST